MKTHPWQPIILKNTKKLIVGTLPPKSAKFYFSNSTKTRLWDLLFSIQNNLDYVVQGSNDLSDEEKRNLFENLNLGIADVTYEFERDKEDSVEDKHIDPKQYRNLLTLIEGTEIDEVLFVYKNAAKWFLHSLTGEPPVRVAKLNDKIEPGTFEEKIIGDRKIKFTLMQSVLNRSRIKGETLNKRLEIYREKIKYTL